MNEPNDASRKLPPSLAILQMLTGKWVSQAVSTAAQLELAEHLASGAKSATRLAELAQVNERALCSLLRALASVGVFNETANEQFENTPLSDALRAKAPGSMRSMALLFGEHPTWDAWGELGYTIRTGKPSFEKVNGAPTFQYFRQHADTTSYFNEAFSANSAQETEAIHRAYDFSVFESLVDVGGGQGALVCSCLRKNPAQRGTLFDQPGVVADASSVIAEAGVGERCQAVGGNFFEQVPAGASAYLLKHVLFNWGDESARKILHTVRRAMREDSRLLIIDPLRLPGNGQMLAKFLDLEMRVLYDGGGQRTEDELRAILESCELRIARIVPTDSPTCFIVEAAAA